MFGVKETVSTQEEEEDAEVEFRTGSPQREQPDKRFLIEPDGHLLIQQQEGKQKVNENDYFYKFTVICDLKSITWQ